MRPGQSTALSRLRKARACFGPFCAAFRDILRIYGFEGEARGQGEAFTCTCESTFRRFCLLSLPNRVTCNDTRYLLFGGGGGGGFLEPLDVPGREGSGGGGSSGLASLPVAFAPTALPAACFVSFFLASQLGVKPCPHGHGLSSLCLTSSTSVMRPNLPAGTWLIVLGFDFHQLSPCFLSAGASVFDLSVSVSPPATSEGPGPLRRKQKQNVFKRFSGLWALE